MQPQTATLGNREQGSHNAWRNKHNQNGNTREVAATTHDATNATKTATLGNKAATTQDATNATKIATLGIERLQCTKQQCNRKQQQRAAQQTQSKTATPGNKAATTHDATNATKPARLGNSSHNACCNKCHQKQQHSGTKQLQCMTEQCNQQRQHSGAGQPQCKTQRMQPKNSNTREESSHNAWCHESNQKYIPGSPNVRIKPQSMATYLADPRDWLKSRKPAPKDRKSTALKLKHAACKGTAATLGNKAATNLTARANAAITSGNSSPPLASAPQWSANTREQQWSAMISQNTRAAMIRNDQQKHESKQCSAMISTKPQSTWSPCQLMGTPAYYVTQERRPLASIVSRLTLPKLHLATYK